VTREQIADLGWQCTQGEWAFDEAAGFTLEDDVLPPCAVEEGVGPEHSLEFDAGPEIIAAAKLRFPIRDEPFAIKAIG
jgi:hypothetical protein